MSSKVNVPELRFSEFNVKWKESELQALQMNGYNITYGVLKPGEYVDNGIALLQIKDIESNDINTKNIHLMSHDLHTQYKRTIISENDILISVVGTIGRIAKVPASLENCNIHRNLALIKVKSSVSNDFIFHKLLSSDTQHEISRKVIGSTQDLYNLSDLRKLKIRIPSFIEQEKIASFLTSVDTKIEQLTSKAKLLQEYKKGVMQKIFSQEIRFHPKGISSQAQGKDDDGSEFPEWVEKKLGEVFDITSSKRVFQEDWTSSGVPFYRAREVVKLSRNGYVDNELFITRKMFEEYVEKYGVPIKNDLLVTGVGTLGKLYVVKENDEFYFKDGNIVWFKTQDLVNSQYIKQLFDTRIIKKQISDNASITTVGTFTIDSAKKTKFPFPCLKEQTKIANFLSSIDSKIEQAQKQLASTKEFKKALLQQMFV